MSLREVRMHLTDAANSCSELLDELTGGNRIQQKAVSAVEHLEAAIDEAIGRCDALEAKDEARDAAV